MLNIDRNLKQVSGIYQILNNKNMDFYIGSAVDFYDRFHLHKSSLINNTHYNIHLQRAFNKYGGDSFEFKIIQKVEINSLIEKEQYYLDTLNPVYNICKTAGSCLGREVTIKTRKQISEKLTGKIVSEETCQKLSESNTGRDAWNKDKEQPIETIEKIRNTMLKIVKRGEEHPCFGVKWTKERLEKWDAKGKKNHNYKIFSNEDIKNIISLYQSTNYSLINIGKMYNVSNVKIKNILIENSIKIVSKKTNKKIFCSTNNKEYFSTKEASKDLSIDSGSIIDILKGRKESVKGYVFNYV